MYCRIRKMVNGSPNRFGMMSGFNVPTQCNQVKSWNWGMIVAQLGRMSVRMTVQEESIPATEMVLREAVGGQARGNQRKHDRGGTNSKGFSA